MTSDKIVLAPLGTYGDLRPFLAVGVQLKNRGFTPVIAAAHRYEPRVKEAGLAFQGVGPHPHEYAQRLDLTQQELVRRLANEPRFLIDRLLNPFMQHWYEDMICVSSDAAAVVTHPLAQGARLAAEKLQLAHIGVALSPFSFMSEYDGPVFPSSADFSRRVRRCGRLGGKLLVMLARHAQRRSRQTIDAMRERLELPRAQPHPTFGSVNPRDLFLGLYSPVLGPVRPDYPPRSAIVGFPDISGSDRPEKVPVQLQQFLDAGSPPIVFTLGTAGVYDSEAFVVECDRVAARLRIRAVIIVADPRVPQFSGTVSDNSIVCGYAPYDEVFARAAGIVHHSGIGTIALALRSGRPQLGTWAIGDQPNNAVRLAQLGVGPELALKRYLAGHAEKTVISLLQTELYRERARELALRVNAEEDGAAVAARLIEAELQLRLRNRK